MLRLVIVEDHVAVRKGLQVLLASAGFEVVGAATSADQGLEIAQRERPDATIADIRLRSGTGAQLVRALVDAEPEARAIIYTGVDEADVLTDALDCGARGFVLKASPARDLVQAVQVVARGGTFVDQRLTPLLLARRTTEKVANLTSRERDILALLSEGLSGQEVAEKLTIAPETVRTHIRNAMRKLEASTRAHAIALALRQGHIG